MERFKKLKDGRIVFITSFNYELEIVHGYNIGSFNLRYKNIPFEKIDEQWEPISIEIAAAFKSVNRPTDYQQENYSDIRAQRIRHILDKIFQMELAERHKKNLAA